ncbi:MAG: T9SS type A sorting domain-containing protein [Bacteroidales bacterium]|nr:T9SS type A sorting domain-containing protein [Bacteroidales bacterium]
MQKQFVKTFFLFCFFGLCGSLFAQEFLTVLKTNPQLLDEVRKQKNTQKSGKTENAPIWLPFFEDFSNYTGYPNDNLFVDKQAFVNATFPVFSPTIGVATLDALNEHGEIYPHLTTSPRGADTLTSRFIRLDSLPIEGGALIPITSKDSIYFSFYFQPSGGSVVGEEIWEFIGSQPNINDSLVLEFGFTKDILPDSSVTVWKHIWSTPGFALKDWTLQNPLQYFKQILIPITNIDFFCDRFQFRFRNYASLAKQDHDSWVGNVSQWNIDYIRLDVHRNNKDEFTNDLAFAVPTTSMLEKYQAMPWNQFHIDDLKKNFNNYLTNLSDGPRASFYKYIIYKNENIVYTHPTQTAVNTNPYFSHGFNSIAAQNNPPITYLPVLTDPVTYKIIHVYANAAQGEVFCLSNDTCVYEQKFSNYFAYDDGTAEYGYCLNNKLDYAFLAMKFLLRKSDSISAVRMWFNHTKDSANLNASFTIMVWSDDNGKPGNILYSQDNNNPKYTVNFLDFAEYRLNKKILLDTGVFWIGFKQHGNVQLNIGFDQNSDSRNYFKYNTNGSWETSVFKGTPMLRPVFGKLNTMSIKEPAIPDVSVFPNPTTGELRIENRELKIDNVDIYDVFGRKHKGTKARRHEEEWSLDLSNLANGVYLLRIQTEQGIITKKIIKY